MSGTFGGDPGWTIGDVRLSTVPVDRVLDSLLALLERDPRGAGTAIRLVNTFTMALIHQDPTYGDVVTGPGVNLADGTPLAWLARRQGRRVAVVRGPSLFEEALRISREHPIRHFLLGGTPESLGRLVAEIHRRYPWAELVGAISPAFRPLTPEEQRRQDAVILSSAPDIVWIGTGTPRQDFEAARLAGAYGVVAIGVGAAFDFLGGTKPPAPKALHGTGLEWLFRLLSEPRRLWRRYACSLAWVVRSVAAPGRQGASARDPIIRRPGSGIRVAIVGPDGAGKTSAATQAVAGLRASGLRVRHLHFDPSGEVKAQTAITEPHGSDPRRMTQIAALARRFAEYWIEARPKGRLTRRGVDVVVQERGWLDQVADPRRYRLTPTGGRIARGLYRVAPRYDAIVCFGGHAATIARRKSELAPVEVRRQLRFWESATLPGVRRSALDTTRSSPLEVSSRLETFLADLRARRLTDDLRPVIWPSRRIELQCSSGGLRAARALYRPYSGGGRVRKAVSFRAPGWACGSAPAGDGRVREHVADALAALRISGDALAVIRSVHRDRAVVAVLRAGVVADFVKVAWTSCDGLRHEHDILAGLGCVDGLTVPRVTDFWTDGQRAAVRMAALRTFRAGSPVGWKDALRAAIALRWARDGAGVTHGDLAPWNLVRCGAEGVGLVDWEAATEDFRPGADLHHYFRAIVTAAHGASDVVAATAALHAVLDEYASACQLPRAGLDDLLSSAATA